MVCGLSIGQHKHTSGKKLHTTSESIFDVEKSREKLQACQSNHRRWGICQWSTVQKSCIKQPSDIDTNTELLHSRQLANPLNACESNVQRILVHILMYYNAQYQDTSHWPQWASGIWLVYKYVESLHFPFSFFGEGKSSDFTNWGLAFRPGTASRSSLFTSMQYYNTLWPWWLSTTLCSIMY